MTARSEGRVVRLREVNRVLMEGPSYGFIHSGGMEATWILYKAKDTYIYGFFIASRFASHSACERRLAGTLTFVSGDEPPIGSDRWGLRRLVQWAKQRGSSDDLATPLLDLAENRKQLAHYKNLFGDEPSWVARVLRGPTAEGEWMDQVPIALQAESLTALKTALSLHFEWSGIP